MTLDDTAGRDLDRRWERIVVVFNASDAATTQTVPGTAGRSYALHPVQASGGDPVVKGAHYAGGERSACRPVPWRCSWLSLDPWWIGRASPACSPASGPPTPTRTRGRAAAYARAGHLFGRVPMTWMNKNAGGFPIYLEPARGARVTDVDGHEYVDFCLGDTGAMAGHSPPAGGRGRAPDAWRELGGASTMLPTEDAAWVGAELARRFGVAALELRADRDRRQPLGDPAAARRHRPAADPRQQLLLPRLGRRVADRRRPGRAPAVSREGNVGAPST